MSESEGKQLHLGLEYSFVKNPKHLKKGIAAKFEVVSHRVSESINHDKLEDFHEFLRAYTDIFTKHIYATKDFTYKNLKNIIKDENVAILSGDKDSSIVIMQKDDYNHKLQQMIDEGIKNGIYTPTEDNTLNDLRKFQVFLRRNFKEKFARYEDMRPVSNQPGSIYAGAKTHKFNSSDEINIDNLKFRPIISEIGTYTYNAAKVIAEYLKPLCSNQYKISDTQEFASLIKDQPPLNDEEEYVSYAVDSLFTNIPVAETIEYIIHQIYTEKKIPPICSKLIFKRLLLKLTTECSFQFNHQLLKQVEGCTMGGPLSVTLAEIHMIRMENDVVIPLKPIFYKRFVDDIINLRKKNVRDELFFRLNNYHQSIKLTFEISPVKFLETQFVNLDGKIETKVSRKLNKLPVPWSSNIPKP